MDPSPTAAAAVPVSALALSIAPALAQAPLVLPGLFNPSPLPFPGQEVGRSESLMGKQLAREYFWTLSPAQEDGRTLTSASWSKRGACLWRPWLCFTSDSPRQVRKLVDLATSGATSVKVTKADSKFHHPVRLFWSKSCSFDYLYSYGEILLQSFPVQATINLYEDSDSEEEEEDDEEDKEDEEEEK